MPARIATTPVTQRAAPPRAAEKRRRVRTPAVAVLKRSAKAGKREPARFIHAMKALSVETVPAGKWRLEVKLDGYRAIALLNGNDVELWSRNQKPLTADYPEVVEALRKI